MRSSVTEIIQKSWCRQIGRFHTCSSTFAGHHLQFHKCCPTQMQLTTFAVQSFAILQMLVTTFAVTHLQFRLPDNHNKSPMDYLLLYTVAARALAVELLAVFTFAKLHLQFKVLGYIRSSTFAV